VAWNDTSIKLELGKNWNLVFESKGKNPVWKAVKILACVGRSTLHQEKDGQVRP